MMKKVFTVAAFAGLMACNNEPEIHIMGEQIDFTQETKFVTDSVFLNNQVYIDSLTTVTELLDHLETLPSNEEVSN